MMEIRHVRVIVIEWRVSVPVAVGACRKRIVRVVVMSFIVTMSMLVLQCFVRVNVAVALGGM